MISKQRKKKHPKIRVNGKWVEKPLGIDPTLNPRVVETKSPLTEEEQNENPLGRMKKLPEGFKPADQITKVDELEHECGRLRSYLASFSKEINIEGKIHFIQVDPLNMTVKLLGKSK